MVLAAVTLVVAAVIVVVAWPAGSDGDSAGADAATSAGAPAADDLRRAVIDKRARNVILLVGDGMGDSEITIARNYTVGAAGRLALDTLPLTGSYTTYAVDRENRPVYVTDSAASATGWATGHKTYNGAISVTPDGRPQPTILELAAKAGYRTGSVTTAELTDATPAALAAHVTDRGCAGPGDMAACPTNDRANGGAGSIAEQTVHSGADVLLGGGRQRFDQVVRAGPYAGRTVADEARAGGYAVVTDAAGLAATSGGKVLGLFADGTLDLVWTGPRAAPYPANTEPVACSPAKRDERQPRLADLTARAIGLLESDKGFFLQVEGGSIDKQDHAANPCGQIGETIEFDRAVSVALDYARHHPDTLVVVTADHGHSSQIIEYPQTAEHHSPGAILTLRTVEGAPMVVHYATNLAGRSQDHTGTQVRIAAQGPQAYRVLGLTDQTDLFDTLAAALGVTPR
ncbi:alkaline phosphatase [Luedemannella helvata]|uniref:Alkaline phosphatase n=1 Tax=Luedemannella helvata TaxID=349315 RepID=A0ABP4VUY9_9ACTN